MSDAETIEKAKRRLAAINQFFLTTPDVTDNDREDLETELRDLKGFLESTKGEMEMSRSAEQAAEYEQRHQDIKRTPLTRAGVPDCYGYYDHINNGCRFNCYCGESCKMEDYD
jgi:hypothetical protein